MNLILTLLILIISQRPNSPQYMGAGGALGPPYFLTKVFNCDLPTGTRFFAIISCFNLLMYVIPALPDPDWR